MLIRPDTVPFTRNANLPVRAEPLIAPDALKVRSTQLPETRPPR